MRRVVLESPLAGEIDRNLAYAWDALADSLRRGEAPLASHLLYTQVLSDAISGERRMGILAGHAWVEVAEALVVYSDYGISDGMKLGIDVAQAYSIPIEYRKIK